MVMGLVPILWALLMTGLAFSGLEQIKINTDKIDELIDVTKDGQNQYSVEVETFSKLDGRLIYVPLQTPYLHIAQREYEDQINGTCFSCESGDARLDSIHVWLYLDMPRGSYIEKDTALTRPNEAQ